MAWLEEGATFGCSDAQASVREQSESPPGKEEGLSVQCWCAVSGSPDAVANGHPHSDALGV